jgi:hypothetical protein
MGRQPNNQIISTVEIQQIIKRKKESYKLREIGFYNVFSGAIERSSNTVIFLKIARLKAYTSPILK